MTERPNIRRMQMPERDNDRVFDANAEYSKETWSSARSEIERDSSRTPEDELRILGALMSLGHATKADLSPRLAKEIEETLSVLSTALNAQHLIRILSHVKEVEPLYSFDVRADVWDTVVSLLRGHIQKKHWASATSMAKEMKMVRPDVELLTQEDYQNIEETLEFARKTKNWQAFTMIASSLSLLDPKREFKILPGDWKGLREIIADFHQKRDWPNFVIRAAEMQKIAHRQKPTADTEKPSLQPEALDI